MIYLFFLVSLSLILKIFKVFSRKQKIIVLATVFILLMIQVFSDPSYGLKEIIILILSGGFLSYFVYSKDEQFMDSFFDFFYVLSLFLILQMGLSKRWHKIVVLVTNIFVVIAGMVSEPSINIYYFLLLIILFGILVYYIFFMKEEKEEKNILKKWSFGTDNDYLVDLVLSGKKRATTSLYGFSNLPSVGEESILIYSNGQEACSVKTTMVLVLEFKDITWDLAKLEGENNSLEEWRSEHMKFFKSIDNQFDVNSKVVFEVFEIL